MAQLNCIVVTPETTALEEKAEFIAIQLYDGEIGIAPGHSPMIGRLGYGELRLKGSKAGGGDQRFYIDGGFVQVSDDIVSVLTNRAIPAAKLDTAAAERQLAEAREKPANTPELALIRERMINQARAQLRVARHASGS